MTQSITGDALDPGEPGGESRALYLFMPLPQPLPIPDGTCIIATGDPLGGGDPPRLGPLAGIDVSMKFHQTVLKHDPMLVTAAAVVDVAADAIGQEPVRDQDLQDVMANEIQLRAQLTVVEACVPARGTIDLGAESGADALDRAIEAAQNVQRSYALVTGEPVKLVTLRTLPMAIPVVFGIVRSEADAPGFDDLLLWSVNDRAVVPSAEREPLGPEDLEGLSEVLDEMGEEGPFTTFTDLRREARVQLKIEGNYRQAALTTAIAAEVLLDAILMSLLWEDGEDPSVTSEMFGVDGESLRSRLVSEYHPRLGGSWDKDQDVIADYLNAVINLRNRIAHTGYSPTRKEAKTAQDALGSLERFIGDQLSSCAERRRYPRTAVMFCGLAGLRRRGKCTQFIQELTRDPDEPHWLTIRARWIGLAGLYISLCPPSPRASENDVRLFFEVAGEETRFLLHDATAHAAAEVPASAVDITPEQRRALDALANVLPAPEDRITPMHRSAVEGSVPDHFELEWVREYSLFPELNIHLPENRSQETRLDLPT